VVQGKESQSECDYKLRSGVKQTYVTIAVEMDGNSAYCERRSLFSADSDRVQEENSAVVYSEIVGNKNKLISRFKRLLSVRHLLFQNKRNVTIFTKPLSRHLSLWWCPMVSAQFPTYVPRGNSKVKVEWTLLTAPIYKCSCGTQTTVMYTHVVPHLGPKWHRSLHVVSCNGSDYRRVSD
jgi:hypothetical protein